MTTGLLVALVLAVNAVIMSVEMLATRLLFPRFGNTVFTWSAVISIVVAGLSLGYAAGGWLADKSKRRERLIFYELLAGAVLVAAVPWLCDALVLRSMAPTPPLAACFIVWGLPAAALAAVPPAAVGMLAARGWGPARAAGAVSGLAAAGSIAGTLATTFWLIPAFGVRPLFRAQGLGLAALAALWIVAAKRPGAARSAALALLVAFAAAGIGRAGLRAPRLLEADPIFEKDTRYQLVRVFEQGSGASLMRVLMLDSTHEGGQWVERKDVVFEYTQAYRVFLNAFGGPGAAVPGGKPSSPGGGPRILFIGGGAYAMPLRVAEAIPGSIVEVAEIDPVVEEVGRRYFRAAEAANMRVVVADGRRMLESAAGVYDGIFLDAYQGVMAVPFHLTTREFFAAARRALKPGGILAMNLIGDIQEREGLFCSAASTLDAEFAWVRAHPLHGAAPRAQNVIMLASEQSGRLEGLLAGTPMAQGFDLPGLPCRARRLLTDDYAPVEVLASRYLRN